MAYAKHGLPFIAKTLNSWGGEVAISAKGVTVCTSTGNSIIDLASGGFGYHHPHVLECVKQQASLLPLSSRVCFSRPLALLAKKIAEVTPGNLSISYPCNSTAEAVEGALKLAKGFHRNNKRDKIISIKGSLHGYTMGALSVSGRECIRKLFNDFSLDGYIVQFGDLLAMKEAIDDETAAVILEPVLTKAGISIPAPGYIKKVQNLCQSNDALLILDETNTGLGHCGNWFASNYDGVIPDVMVLGNTLGGGILHGAAYVTKEKINSKVYGKSHPSLHGSTTGGNPMFCAAAYAVIETIEREGLHVRVAEYSKIIGESFRNLIDQYQECFLNYDVCGLLASVQVTDKEIAFELQKKAIAYGVAVNISLSEEGVWIMINPPLIISDAELRTGLEIFENAVMDLETAKISKANISVV